MSTIVQTVSSYLHKKNAAETSEMERTPALTPDDVIDPDEVKENDAPELESDKKTDEVIVPQKQSGILWRMTSGVYQTTTGAVTGAVGLGVGSVKWAAGKGYDAGSAVVTTTKTVAAKVPIPTWKRKAKNE